MRGQKGTEILEFGLILLPMMAFLFLLLDVAWAVFARSALQFAVREAVRYAVTGQVKTGLGHKDSIRAVAQASSIGLLTGQKGADAIHVRFYTPDTFQDISDRAGANAGGNLVEVSVEGYPCAPMGPVMRSDAALSFTARSTDRMEASPATGPPPL